MGGTTAKPWMNAKVSVVQWAKGYLLLMLNIILE